MIAESEEHLMALVVHVNGIADILVCLISSVVNEVLRECMEASFLHVILVSQVKREFVYSISYTACYTVCSLPVCIVCC